MGHGKRTFQLLSFHSTIIENVAAPEFLVCVQFTMPAQFETYAGKLRKIDDIKLFLIESNIK